MRKLVVLLLSLAPLLGCVEPTQPVFQLEEPFYLVEGKITDLPGTSEVRVQIADFSRITLRFVAIEEASVSSVEEGAGTRVSWDSIPGKPGHYAPPADFAARTGESWSVEVDLPDGTRLFSEAETMPVPVPITGLAVEFSQESSFDEGRNRFVPAFEIRVDFTDPAGVENFYEWDYRYWEKVVVCTSCFNGDRFNGQECVPGPFFVPRYDYLCEADTECFLETQGQEFDFATDEFFDGASVTDRQIGAIDFIAFGGLLVEAIQYGITPEAYAYGRVIVDLIDGATGLNATIPAALDGNLSNADPDGLEVLGYVGVATIATERFYLERSQDTGTPLPADRQIRLEPSNPPFEPPRAPCIGEGRAPMTPEGWPE